MIDRPGLRQRNLRRLQLNEELERTNTILKQEMQLLWSEVRELKSLLSLMDKPLSKLKELDSEETIAEIRKYKAKRFN